jgi:hypothetical protein
MRRGEREKEGLCEEEGNKVVSEFIGARVEQRKSNFLSIEGCASVLLKRIW